MKKVDLIKKYQGIKDLAESELKRLSNKLNKGQIKDSENLIIILNNVIEDIKLLDKKDVYKDELLIRQFVDEYNKWLLKEGFCDADIVYEFEQYDNEYDLLVKNFVSEYNKDR